MHSQKPHHFAVEYILCSSLQRNYKEVITYVLLHYVARHIQDKAADPEPSYHHLQCLRQLGVREEIFFFCADLAKSRETQSTLSRRGNGR